MAKTQEIGTRGLSNDGYITGPRLRELIGVSAVTLWRWRNDKAAGFPAAIKINDRLYFRKDEIAVWLSKQRSAA